MPVRLSPWIVLIALLGAVGSAFAPGALAASPPPAVPAHPQPSPSPALAPFLGLPRGNPWTAATLSLAVTGLGQLYNAEPEKGYGMMSAWLVFPLALGVDALSGRSYGRVFSYAVNLGVKAWSVVDAFGGASPPAPTPSAPPPAGSPSAKP